MLKIAVSEIRVNVVLATNSAGFSRGVNNPVEKVPRRAMRMNILLLITRILNILEGKDVAAFQLIQIILQRGSVDFNSFSLDHYVRLGSL